MSSRLLIYNPENDLALAYGGERFTPPAAAVEIAKAGVLLPFWWADDDDYVAVRREFDADAARLCDEMGLKGRMWHGEDVEVVEPWGWSADLRCRLRDSGVDVAAMPSADDVERLRQLSHRRTTIELHRMLSTPEDLRPVEAKSVDEAYGAMRRFDAAVVKQPWSCSGRGVMFSRECGDDAMRRFVAGSIRRQGSVMVEPEYEREDEMAALFYCNAGTVRLEGMSRFVTDGRGGYVGNLVDSQENIMRMCGADAVEAAKSMEAPLQCLLEGVYRGWIGVDMLRYAGGLNRCVEINMRMTMGVVAMQIYRRISRSGMLTTGFRDAGTATMASLSPSGTRMAVFLEYA